MCCVVVDNTKCTSADDALWLSWEESIQPVSVGGKAHETKGSQILEGKTRNNILGEY